MTHQNYGSSLNRLTHSQRCLFTWANTLDLALVQEPLSA